MATAAEKRRRELCGLRRRHNQAVDEFRYADAAEIQAEMNRIIGDPLPENWHRSAGDRFPEIKSRFIAQQQRYDRERERVLARYRIRFDELTARHDEELRALAAELEEALNRELVRPIAEVDHLLLRSKVFAKDHQYAYADEVCREAIRRKEEVICERCAACKATYRDQKRRMIERHVHELSVMDEGITAHLEHIDLEYGMSVEIIGRTHRINQFRNGVWPPENYSLGYFHERTDVAREFRDSDEKSQSRRSRKSRSRSTTDVGEQVPSVT
jgi:hypothetical protein